MTIDWTVKLTDITMVFAALLSPLIAVQVTEYLRRRKEARDRKLHLFRVLMSTRTTMLAPGHVEALNLIDIEFDAKISKEKKVVDVWKLYNAHLGDASYPRETWNVRRAEILVDLLYEMAIYLGYGFDKAHIKSASYYPKGYGETEEEQQRLRRAILTAFDGGALRVTPHQAEIQRKTEGDQAKQPQG